jgi:hypothetical protein
MKAEPTGMTESHAGLIAPRKFYADNVTVPGRLSVEQQNVNQ